MPAKEMQQFIPLSTTIKQVWNGGTETREYSQARWETLMRSRGWANTPGFRSKRQSRTKTRPADLPMNLYTDLVRQTPIPEPKKLRFWPDVWYPNYFEITGCLTPMFQDAPNMETTLLRNILFNEAVAQLPAKMNGTSFNLPLFIAEAHKTVSMIGEMATDVAKFLQAISRGQKKIWTQRQVDGLYMEYRYGWRLLVRDIVDACKAIYDAMRGGVLQKATSYAKSSSVSSGSLGDYWISDPNIGITGTVIRKTDALSEVRITLYYRDDHPWTGTLQQFGISNPFLLGWEVIPLSFVVDWVLNVGGFLSSIDAFLGKAFVKGCVSYKVTHKNSYSLENIRGLKGARPLVDKNTLSGYDQVVTAYRREPLTSFPSAKLPTINVNLNMNRAMDGIALMKQAWIPKCRGYTIRVR